MADETSTQLQWPVTCGVAQLVRAPETLEVVGSSPTFKQHLRFYKIITIFTARGGEEGCLAPS